jgi:hypothetical protein
VTVVTDEVVVAYELLPGVKEVVMLSAATGTVLACRWPTKPSRPCGGD